MTTIEYLDRELRRVDLSMRRAAKKPNAPPEELRGLQEKRANLCEARAAVLEMQARPEAGKPLTLEQLRELVEADRNGRCVVFPCRPSDVTVYQLRNKKHARGIGVHPRHIHCATVWADGRYQLEHQGMEPCRDKDLGKKWFLSEEAANAALAKEE